MNRKTKSRGYVWREPTWLPSERDLKDRFSRRRALERRQVLRDGQLEDSFQDVKPKRKHKKSRTKDTIILKLIEQYMSKSLTRHEYAEKLVKTLPESKNTSQ